MMEKLKSTFRKNLCMLLILSMIFSLEGIPDGIVLAEEQSGETEYAQTTKLENTREAKEYTIHLNYVSDGDYSSYEYEEFNNIILPGDTVVFEFQAEPSINQTGEKVWSGQKVTYSINISYGGAELSVPDNLEVSMEDLVEELSTETFKGKDDQSNILEYSVTVCTKFKNKSDKALRMERGLSSLKSVMWNKYGDNLKPVSSRVYYYRNYSLVPYDESVEVQYDLKGGSVQGETLYGNYYLRNPEEAYDFTIPCPVKEGYHFVKWENDGRFSIGIYDGYIYDHKYKEYVKVVNGQSFVEGRFFLFQIGGTKQITMGFYGKDAEAVYGNSNYIFNRSETDYSKKVINAVYQEDYTVTLDANGGVLPGGLAKRVVEVSRLRENTEENEQKGLGWSVTGCDITLPANIPTREGYVFGGWYSDEELKHPFYGFEDFRSYDLNGDGKIDNADAAAPFYNLNDKICRLYAKWDTPKYSITYHLDGGTNSSSNPSEYDKNGETVTLAAPTKEGYTFDGWYSDAAFQTKVTEIAKESTGEKVFYAKWIPNSYTIKFDGNGATEGSMQDMACSYGQKYVLTENAYKKAGADFEGWNTAANGSGKVYADKAEIENLSAENGAAVTLYAQWKSKGYSITYYLNGGENNPSNPAAYDTSEEITLAAPSRKGYDFDGWYSDSAFVEKVSQITRGSTGNKLLYAKWKAHKYSVVFDSNGGSGSMAGMNSCTYGERVSLPANKFKRAGYSFAGWNTKADGSGIRFQNKSNIENLTDVEGAAVTLYAQWREGGYAITYNLGGGDNHPDNPDNYDENSDTIVLKEPSQEGYVFDGWYTAPKYTAKNKVTEIAKGSKKDRTLFAKWIANKYTISFDGNGYDTGNSGKMADLADRAYGRKYTLPKNKFKRAGYTFIGWNTEKDGSGTNYKDKANIQSLSSKDGDKVVLYAQWKLNEYTITYKLNGGGYGDDVEDPNPTSYNANTATIVLKEPIKAGYTFGGWYTDAKCKEKNKIAEITKGSAGKKILYAKWIANKYTIVFDGNDATSGNMPEKANRSYGKKFSLPVCKYKKAGYVFAGWNTAADGSGTAYKNKASVKNLTEQNEGRVILYAQWKAK